MTLQQFFDWVQMHPNYSYIFYLGVPAIALIADFFSQGEGHVSPWKYLYSALIYLVCIPGIFIITLNIYFFFWERRSIMDTELLIQVLPILSMIATLFIIKKNVNLNYIPGFDKLSGLMLIIGIILTLMWILDRTHIYSITFMPFSMVLLVIVTGIVLLRFGLKKLLS